VSREPIQWTSLQRRNLTGPEDLADFVENSDGKNESPRLNLLLSLTKRAPAPIAATGAYEVIKAQCNQYITYITLSICATNILEICKSSYSEKFLKLDQSETGRDLI